MPNHVNCPACNGPIYNNIAKNATRVAEGKKPMPNFSCRDKDGCGWVEWPPKGQKPAMAQRGATAGRSSAPARPLAPLYLQCLTVAKQSWDKVLGVGKYSDAVLQAAAATIFIGARDGAPILEPKAPTPKDEYVDDTDLTD